MTLQKLLNNTNKWCKGAEAENKKGDIIKATDKGAIKYCLSGALIKAYRVDKLRKRARRKLASAIKATGFEFSSCVETDREIIIDFNDCSDTNFTKIKKVIKLANV